MTWERTCKEYSPRWDDGHEGVSSRAPPPTQVVKVPPPGAAPRRGAPSLCRNALLSAGRSYGYTFSADTISRSAPCPAATTARGTATQTSPAALFPHTLPPFLG
jgi:hypothetical protein